jgi:FK506-binding nuclear protein
VHYIGKLKKNDKIFDSNVGRAPFKFCLGTTIWTVVNGSQILDFVMIKLLSCDHAGVGQVIKGWDVGVNGRHIND